MMYTDGHREYRSHRHYAWVKACEWRRCMIDNCDVTEIATIDALLAFPVIMWMEHIESKKKLKPVSDLEVNLK